MITQYYFDGPLLKSHMPDGQSGKPVSPVWVDLLEPNAAEQVHVGESFGLHLPTLEEMSEIEISSRLYEEGGAYFMTFTYISDALGVNPATTPFTFVLKGNLLITMREKDMRIINYFIAKSEKQGCTGPHTNTTLLILILENIIDLWADALEKNHLEIESESRKIFSTEKSNKDFKKILEQIAKIDDLNSKMRESLASLNRLHIFLGRVFEEMKVPKETVTKLRTLVADIHSLLDHAGFVSGKIAFLLDATLGLVNIEQNAIIKIFSVAAVIFLPPTLVASIYGMNFRHMPELDWILGYPTALFLMILSAMLPYWYFKRRDWL